MLIDARAHVVWGCATARGSEYVADTIYFIYSDDEEGPLRRSDLNLFEGGVHCGDRRPGSDLNFIVVSYSM